MRFLQLSVVTYWRPKILILENVKRFSLIDSSLDTSLIKLRTQIGTLCSRTDSHWERLSYLQKNETTLNIVGPTKLWVVAFVLAVVCKRMQHLPTMLGPAVHRREKDTDHKTSMRVCGPNHVGTAMLYGSNIVGLRFGDHTTKEILRVVSSKVLLVSNFAQQLPTTRNNM